MAGKTNTARIEELESLTKNLEARLQAQDVTLEWLKKGAESAEEEGKNRGKGRRAWEENHRVRGED